MRADEIFVKNAIEKLYLVPNFKDFVVLDGNDPPDYIIIINNEIISLEITQCKPVVMQNSKLTESETYIQAIQKFVNELELIYSDSVHEQECLLFNFQYPVNNWNKFKLIFRKSVEELLITNFNNEESGVIIIGNELVKWTKLIRPVGKRIIGSIEAKLDMQQPNINKHVCDILLSAITRKNKLVDKVNQSKSSRLWLGIYNDYFLAELSTYEKVFSDLEIDHNFEKIFVVDRSGDVLVLNCN